MRVGHDGTVKIHSLEVKKARWMIMVILEMVK